jgi:translation initiation factor IF-2
LIKKKKKLSKKEEKALKKTQALNIETDSYNTKNEEKKPQNQNEQKQIIEIPNVITVREFADRLGMSITEIIKELMKNGVMASINESIDFETAAIVGDELGYEIKNQKIEANKSEKKELSEAEKKQLKPRPPVVVVMGHVDHGKTTLLDYIRKTNVAAKESGGITQHIGAYQVNWQDKDKNERIITFLDTPGHEAFSAMRAHGANITDIAILVVAADDGVKPQTKEAISHAKAANVPIIVAINKIDKPEADPERVKRELADLDLLPEEWGGKTIMVPISAKNGKNVGDLLDIVLVVADMEELVANPSKNADGVVIESHMQSGIGPIATVLIKNGTIKTGQVVLTGNSYGKIRFMENFQGKRISQAGPSTPVKIAGFKNVPKFGELLQIVEDERTARNIIAKHDLRTVKFGLKEISEEAKKGNLQELNLILKADMQGSLEAIKTSLESLGDSGIKVKILSSGIGDVTESDVNMAVASKAIIVGFKVIIPKDVKKLAEDKNIKISIYDIIYNLIDDISAALQGMLEPEITEEIVGKFEAIKVFYANKNNKIVGGKVIDGKLVNGLKVHLYHSGEKSGEGKIVSLKLEQKESEEVLKGFECGVGIDTTSNIKPGDVIEAYQTIEILRKIKSN